MIYTHSMKPTTLFIWGCIPTRVFLTYLAYIVSKPTLKYMGYVALLPAIGFMYFYLSGTRKTGVETGGAPIWWNHLRPIHAALYATFAYFAIMGDRRAWMALAADALLGLTAFIIKHYV